MGKFLGKVSSLYRQFLNDTRAVAAVEFAFILPLMLLLYIGTAEASRLFIMDRKVAVVAGTVGDLVARMDGTLPSGVLDDYFRAAKYTMLPYNSDELTQRVTGLLVDATGTGRVIWSRGFNGAVPRPIGSVIEVPNEMSQRFQNKFLIAGEASIYWRPMVDFVYTSGMDLDKIYFYRPRYDDTIVLN